MHISELTLQVQRNCDISDARHAGVYSLCGLLLRLRDLYKWEHDLSPWVEPDPPLLLDWVESREQLWEELANEELLPIEMDGEAFDPFDVAGINRRIRRAGLVYGAGFAIGMKPSFFLARLAGSKRIRGLRVDTLGRELARDIFMSPAMRQQDRIVARSSAMLFFLWDQVLELRPSASEALGYGLRRHGLDVKELRRFPSELGPRLEDVARTELDVWVYHEIGEASETGFGEKEWREIVSTCSNSPVEILARVIKDILADTHPEGLLRHIIENRIHSSLSFYAAFMRPFTRAVFPEVREAFRGFVADEDWGLIEQARKAGRLRAREAAEKLLCIHAAEKDAGRAIKRISAEIIEPLGISVSRADDDPD